MMKDEPEVRLESRVEQKDQRVEMRIYIFETFFKKKKKKFRDQVMMKDEPEVRLESRVEQKSQRVEISIRW
jgi:hypothetical protein